MCSGACVPSKSWRAAKLSRRAKNARNARRTIAVEHPPPQILYAPVGAVTARWSMLGIAICAAVIALISMGIGLSSAGAVGPLALVLALAKFAVAAACAV